MICGTGCIKISLDINRIYPEYLNEYLKIDVLKKWFSLNSVGSTMENLNSDILALVPILIPPKSEQIEISEFIETATIKISTAVSLKEQEIEKLKEYKSTLIDNAATGK
jgi:type I restriction enzyme S subunit